MLRWQHTLSWLRGWHIHYGSWWMIQWSLHRWLSLGVHIDLARRRHSRGFFYGPYVDFHVLCVIISIGRNPAYSSDFERAYSAGRGGLE